MLETIFDNVAGNSSKTVAGKGAPTVGVQASVASGTLTGGTLTVSGSLDGTHFDAITALGFDASEITAKTIKLAAAGYPYLKFDLEDVTWAATGTIAVVLKS